MSRLITRTIGASVGLVAVLAWSPQARAQEEEEAPAAEVAQPAPDTPSVRVAQDDSHTVQPASRGRSESPPSHARAGASLMLTGLLTFGLSYVPAAFVANESTLSTDRKLTVPFGGPWMDLLARPGCGAVSGNCGGETAYQALLMFDGFFQVLSGIEVLAGLVEMGQDDTPAASKKATKSDAASLHVTPSSLGAGGYGLAAFGKF